MYSDPQSDQAEVMLREAILNRSSIRVKGGKPRTHTTGTLSYASPDALRKHLESLAAQGNEEQEDNALAAAGVATAVTPAGIGVGALISIEVPRDKVLSRVSIATAYTDSPAGNAQDYTTVVKCSSKYVHILMLFAAKAGDRNLLTLSNATGPTFTVAADKLPVGTELNARIIGANFLQEMIEDGAYEEL